MNIAIVGYGRMGHEVERILSESNEHSIAAIACRSRDDTLTAEHISTADVVIDFSGASVMSAHLELYQQLGVSAVIGTTGWDITTEMIKKINHSNCAVVVGSNFSIGAHIFVELLKYASQALSKAGGYDVFGVETHHSAKADSPSGTAKVVAGAILDNFSGKNRVEYDRITGQIDQSTLHIASVRGGVSRGRHEVIFDSMADQISIAHCARDRSGFAAGAIRAAELIYGRTGYFEFNTLLTEQGAKL